MYQQGSHVYTDITYIHTNTHTYMYQQGSFTGVMCAYETDYIHTYMYTYVHISTGESCIHRYYTHTYIQIHIRTCINRGASLGSCVHMKLITYIHTYIHVHIRTYINRGVMYTQILHTYIHTNTHTYMYQQGSFTGVMCAYETEGVGWPCVIIRGNPWLFDACQVCTHFVNVYRCVYMCMYMCVCVCVWLSMVVRCMSGVYAFCECI